MPPASLSLCSGMEPTPLEGSYMDDGRRTNCACTPCRSLNSVRFLLSGRVLFTSCVTTRTVWILWSCLQLCRGCRFWSGWMDGRLAQVTFNDSWNCIHATSTTDSTAKVVARGIWLYVPDQSRATHRLSIHWSGQVIINWSAPTADSLPFTSLRSLGMRLWVENKIMSSSDFLTCCIVAPLWPHHWLLRINLSHHLIRIRILFGIGHFG